ncbi:MAG: glutamine synthetase, partial [Acidimicrobiia bacterium]|nr:glutamine synthetase [Acidimicrobiia bacterium]
PMNRRCLEIRNADSACNLYLGLAATIAAGLDGLEREADPGPPINVDTYKSTKEELNAMGVHRLPVHLGAALAAFASDDLVKGALGKEFAEHYRAYKEAEWIEYSTVVDRWEVDKYLKVW